MLLLNLLDNFLRGIEEVQRVVAVYASCDMPIARNRVRFNEGFQVRIRSMFKSSDVRRSVIICRLAVTTILHNC